MRSDMAKVIVERPRRGPRQKLAKGYRRRLQRTADEELPSRESIFALKGRTRQFSEHLGPLRRYLQSQVGRPWSLVFSEICAHLHVDSAVQSHLRDHVLDFVETQGLVLERWGWRCFYVCPRTGKLREIPPTVRKRRPQPIVRVTIDDSGEYRLIRGLWFEVELKPLAHSARRAWDLVLRLPVGEVYPSLAIKTYGALVYAAKLRQLNTRELRRSGLNNTPAC